jgi:hypothetical protein
VQVFTSKFIALPCASPFGPNTTERNAAKVGSETKTISHRSARSCGLTARVTWRSNNGRIAASLMSKIVRLCPPSTSLPAIGWPMFPTPRNPASITRSSPFRFTTRAVLPSGLRAAIKPLGQSERN